MNIYGMFDKWMAGICRKNEWIPIVCLIWMAGIYKKNE